MWRILLVDEDRSTRDLLVKACFSFASILHVSTAAEARRTVDRGPVHLIVSEHRLGDASGLDLLRAIKPRRPRLPFIISTAHGSEAVCASALKLGARDYFIKPWSEAEMGTSILAILNRIERQHDIRHNVLDAHLRSEQRPAVTDGDEPIRRAARSIRERYWEPPSLAGLANSLGLSTSSVSRKFKRIVKTPYRRYLIECRVARARELLAASTHSMTEIAQMVGFSDLPRFDKVFKAEVGCSPSYYRANRDKDGAGNY